ncbi:glycosyltransferase family 2 protein, partial [Salmonella enterica subsp. enterica serovar Albany]|nr:glycosyltransferase family 2 protein [Salmonella enterica subsp. enterica serovar Albany]EDW0724156.1 glycosyltransferase family 2 protein [Salmonella enterica subsp. enterica]
FYLYPKTVPLVRKIKYIIKTVLMHK